MGHGTGRSHRIGARVHPGPAQLPANRGSTDAKRGETKERGPRERRKADLLLHVLTLSCSHEALVHFSCHYPQRNHCAFCLQNVSRLRLLPAPAVIQATVISHLDYGSNFLKGIPACAPRLRFPPLVISSWALIPQKGPRLPSLCASADLSPECQIPLSHWDLHSLS